MVIIILILMLACSQIASFLLYLSDVEEGGETMFPFEVSSMIYIAYFFLPPLSKLKSYWLYCSDFQNGENADSNYDFRKCIGLKIKPRKGDGLLFYSLYPNGTIDPVSSHFYWKCNYLWLILFVNFLLTGISIFTAIC